MGPGYFPTILGALLLLVGVAALVRSFLVRGEPIGPIAWKGALLVTGATVLFGAAAAAGRARPGACRADPGQRFRSVKFRFDWRAIALMIGLVVFCALVFVKGLGLPMPLLGTWFGGLGAATMELLSHLALGFSTAFSALNLFYCLIGVLPRHGDRRAARPRAGRHDRDAAAGHVRPRAGLRADHAGRHLLRRAVRRLDDGDPGQPAGRVVVGGHRARRLPDGAQRAAPASRSPPPRSARSSPARSCTFLIALAAPPLRKSR